MLNEAGFNKSNPLKFELLYNTSEAHKRVMPRCKLDVLICTTLEQIDKEHVILKRLNMSKTILKIENLKVQFDIKSNKHIFDLGYDKLKAVDNISFNIKQGDTLGIARESGCGKSTLARAIIDLTPVTSGKIFFQGKRFN